MRITMEKDQNSMSAVIETLVKKGFHISSMVLEKSNLETVFLQLTGKKLRD